MPYYLEFDGAGYVSIPTLSREFVGDGTAWDLEFQAWNTAAAEFAVVGTDGTNNYIILRSDNTVDLQPVPSGYPVTDVTDPDAVYRFEFRILAGNVRELSFYENDVLVRTDTVSLSGILPDRIGMALSARAGALKYLKYTDYNNSANDRYYDPSASNGTGSVLTDTSGNSSDGTLVNFPTDDSQWVEYSDSTLATPINLGAADLRSTSARLTWERG